MKLITAMSDKPDSPEEGTNDEQKQQLVYMMPQQDFDEDEIDLWQLFLPLIKYKVQILLFLMVGLVIGLGYPLYKKPQAPQQTTSIKSMSESIGNTLMRLTEELELGKQDLFSLIDQTQADGKQLLITGAEYQYTTKDNPGKVQIIKLDTFRDLKTTTTQAGTHDLILTIESLPTTEMIKQLKNAYSELLKLDQVLLILNQKRKIGQINVFTRTNGKDAPTIDSKNKNGDFQTNLAGFPRLRYAILQSKIQSLHDTLSAPVYFEFKHNKVPWAIWKDIKAQLKEEEEEEDKEKKMHQNVIKKKAETLKSKTAEISKYQMMDYLITNNLKLPVDRFNWPSVAAVQSFLSPPTMTTTAPISSKKVLLICIAIALLLGIFSVYLRVFAGNLSRREGFEKQRQEFMKAFKHWKL
ncbi:MAG: hypothetical protein HOD85_04075 [Deltaproteobacteria bacterium]|nr:hypothetical protein [Deltaproteobacteria bacterium]